MKILKFISLFALLGCFLASVGEAHPDDPGAHYKVACQASTVDNGPSRGAGDGKGIGNRPRPGPGDNTTTVDTCTITYPTVTAPWTEYPEITLNQGDSVEISASGCVQDGGKGKTWKDYVNPQGKKSERMYFGEYKISVSPTSNLVAAKRFSKGEPDKVNIPKNSPARLWVGYVDDQYSDNGYWGHDDGDNDQCKGVYQAVVVVKITRSGLAAVPYPGM